MRTSRPLKLKDRLKRYFEKFIRALEILVNIVSYLLMAYGLFRGLYYSYFSPNVGQFVATVAMTVFAIYINLKNPNN